MKREICVIGAGMGGLAAAIELAAAGHQVTLIDAQKSPGGKVSTLESEGCFFDGGPTVLTLKHIFDGLFARAGTHLEEWVTLDKQTILARHAFADGTWLDLTDDRDTNGRAIGHALGDRAKTAYHRFATYAEQLYERAAAPFIYAPRPTFASALKSHGLQALTAPWSMDSRRTMRSALGHYFAGLPHLQQLFARYATYSGASPDRAPATFNLISHVEAMGVWTPRGGMRALPEALLQMAQQHLGVAYLPETRVDRIVVVNGRAAGVALSDGRKFSADAVIFNGDSRALENGFLGSKARIAPSAEAKAKATGLSAITLVCEAEVSGPKLAHHNVLFAPFAPGSDEFHDIFERRELPLDPSLYLCAQDRAEGDATRQSRPDKTHERLFFLFNAPALPELSFSGALLRCRQLLERRFAPLNLLVKTRSEMVMRTPADFAQRFSGSQGALYGRPPHSWRALFDRHGSKTSILGLFLTGGTTHPGPGLPMATQSGRLAAEACLKDLRLMPKSRPEAMPGGTWTPKAMMAPMRSVSSSSWAASSHPTTDARRETKPEKPTTTSL